MEEWLDTRKRGRKAGYNILGDVTEVLDLGLEAPVPFVLGKEGVLVEEAAREVSFRWFVTCSLAPRGGGCTNPE